MHEQGAELLRQVAEVIRNEPEAHNQAIWGDSDSGTECGTVACIAGHAVVLAGYNLGAGFAWLPEHPAGPLDVGMTAQKLLGLSLEEADIMFECYAHPVDNLIWPEALEKAAAGTAVADVLCNRPNCQEYDTQPDIE